MEQDQEMSSKMATIEDLHTRLKLNIDNIQQLNTQVTLISQFIGNSLIRIIIHGKQLPRVLLNI